MEWIAKGIALMIRLGLSSKFTVIAILSSMYKSIFPVSLTGMWTDKGFADLKGNSAGKIDGGGIESDNMS